MITFYHNSGDIFLLPFGIAISALDVFLFLACLRLTLGQLPVTRNTRFTNGLKQIVDPAKDFLCVQLLKFTREIVPTWLAWVALFVIMLLVRRILVALVYHV